MNSTRRQILMFAGGSAAGVLFTPVPWRLVTDSALWSENWPGIPAPPRGEIRTRFTNCSLCTAGCAVRARCVGDQPVELAGVAPHPLSHGALCAFGIAGHHLPYLPARVKSGPSNEAAAAVAQGIAQSRSGECVATLDLRPGRTASWTYRRAMAALPNGRYLAPASIDPSVAIDLSKARTVLSFGVPVLEGWGTPGNVNAARGGFRLIQIDPVESRTASMADRWVRIRPGSDDALAQALAGRMTPSAAAVATGLAESEIASLAADLEQNGPVLVLGSSELASAGRTVVKRREPPVPAGWRKAAPVSRLDSLPDRSIRVLLIDESAPGEYIPWKSIERKLAEHPVVVALAWSREGYASHADYVLPVGVYPEVAADIPAAIDSVAATFRIAAPLVAPPAGMVNPEQFIAAAAGLSIADTLRERADAIHQAARGALFTYADAKSTPVKEVKPDDFWKALNAGACWIDEIDPQAAPAQLATARPQLPPGVVLHRELAPGSPILSKLYRESNLRLGPNCVALDPASGWESGAKAILETAAGKLPVTVLLDAGVPPGVMELTASPAILDLCADGASVKVVRA